MFTRDYEVLFEDKLEKTGARLITFKEKGTEHAPFDIVIGYDKGIPIMFGPGSIVKITFEKVK